MNGKQECMRVIFDICKDSEATIKKHKEDKTASNPISADFVKTEKAMAYEDILTEVKKFAAIMKAETEGATNGN